MSTHENARGANTTNWIRRVVAGIVLTVAALAMAFGVNAGHHPFVSGFVLHGATADTSSAKHKDPHHGLHTFGFDY